MAPTYSAQQIADKIQDAIYAAYTNGLPIVEYYVAGGKRVRKDIEAARLDLRFWRELAKEETATAQGVIVSNYATFKRP